MINKIKSLLVISVFFVFYCSVTSTYAQSEQKNRFEPIGIKDEKIFVAYFDNFKKLIRNNDKHGLEKLMSGSYSHLIFSYDKPGANAYNTANVKIKNKALFLKYYPKVFTVRMRNFISNQEVKDLTVNYMGVMLGRGQIWWKYDQKNKLTYISSIGNLNDIFK